MKDANQNDSINKANRRLKRALDQLAQKAGQMQDQMQNANEAGQMDEDRARLAAELDDARTRAAVMEDAAQEASEALDAAIADVRAALGEAP